MKYKLEELDKPVSLESFAEKYRLEMVVTERPRHLQGLGRYYARFPGSEVKQGNFLFGVYGNGETPEEAIMEYAKKIEGCLLVTGAYSFNRREIEVPQLDWSAV